MGQIPWRLFDLREEAQHVIPLLGKEVDGPERKAPNAREDFRVFEKVYNRCNRTAGPANSRVVHFGEYGCQNLTSKPCSTFVRSKTVGA